MFQKNAQFGFIALIALAMLTRFFPHAPNFTAVGAAAIFGGFAFSKSWKAFLVPVMAMFFSDLLINNVMYAAFYDGFQWFTPGFGYIYSAFILSVLLGKLQQGKFRLFGLLSSGVLSAILFFLITNFGSWQAGILYPKTLSGLMACYAAGLPFFLNQLAGTLVYGSVLFGAAYYFFGLLQVQKVRA